MAQNLVINGITYNGVESLEMTNDNGEKVLYTEGGSGGGGSEDLNAVLTEQESLIDELKEVLRGKASGGGGDPTLPDGYVRCSYIQFNAAQVVDTGIIGNQDTKIKVLYTREVSSVAYLYGCASSDNTAAITAYMGGNWRFGSKSLTVNPTTDAELINTAIQSKAGVDRITASGSYSGVTDFETIGTLLLGTARNGTGTIGVVAYTGKVLLLQVWQGGTEVLHLVPVVSTDGVYRFYDEVSGAFFDSITDTPLDGGNL